LVDMCRRITRKEGAFYVTILRRYTIVYPNGVPKLHFGCLGVTLF